MGSARAFIALLLVLAAIPGAAAAATPPGELIDIGGRRLHLYCRGGGQPTVVLDAGLGGTHLDWSRVQPALAAHTRVCSYDRAGYGHSDPGPLPRRADRLAADLDRLLRAAAVDGRWLLVGHSLAGLHLRLLAAEHARRVAALVLIEAAHPRQFERFARRAGVQLAPRAGAPMRLSAPSIPAAMPHWAAPLARRLAWQASSMAALRGELLAFRDSAALVEQRAPQLPAALLVISRGRPQWAGHPQSALRESLWQGLQAELASAPGARQLIARRAGHFVHLEQSTLVVDALRALVERQRAGRVLPGALLAGAAHCRAAARAGALECEAAPALSALRR